MKIRNIDELCDGRGFGEMSADSLRRNLYKYSDAGLSFTRIVGGVELGAIVEGVDDWEAHRRLHFPFDLADFNRAVAELEQAAKDVWDATHGCEDCGLADDDGLLPVNPDCKTCGGHGIVI